MSLFAWISLGVFLIAIVGMVMLVLQHWGDLQLLDPMTIKEERQKKERQELMNRRFERVAAERGASFGRIFRSIWRSLRDSYRALYRRLRALDAGYKKVLNPLGAMEPSQKERVALLLTEAKSLARDTKWAEAERRYLDILQMDVRNIEAYRGIGLIYLKQKLYPQAKETLEFLFKSKKADDATFAGLAEVAEAQGENDQAEFYRKQAVEASPKQAHRYVELSQFYMARKRPEDAWEPMERAIELEPKSVKYLEMAFDIALANGIRSKAKELYQQLRLLTEDEDKMTAWKEKLEQNSQE